MADKADAETWYSITVTDPTLSLPLDSGYRFFKVTALW
jgi:hypothetical protein